MTSHAQESGTALARWLAIAALAGGVALVSAPVSAQEDLSEFVRREADGGGVYSLECFQAGRKVISGYGLRIRSVPIRPAGFRHLLFDQNGLPFNVIQTPGLACVIRQTSSE